MNLADFRAFSFAKIDFMRFAEGTLENFRHSYLKESARDYDERRADMAIKVIRSEEVNRSRRREFSVPEAKP